MGVKFKSSLRNFYNKIKSVTFYIYFLKRLRLPKEGNILNKNFQKSENVKNILCSWVINQPNQILGKHEKKRYLIDACSRFYWFQVIVMVVVFCFCWAPYASFAMINILGHGKVGNNDELQARAKASLNILTFCAKT